MASEMYTYRNVISIATDSDDNDEKLHEAFLVNSELFQHRKNNLSVTKLRSGHTPL